MDGRIYLTPSTFSLNLLSLSVFLTRILYNERPPDEFTIKKRVEGTGGPEGVIIERRVRWSLSVHTCSIFFAFRAMLAPLWSHGPFHFLLDQAIMSCTFEAYNQRKINRWALHRLVSKFHGGNPLLVKQHERDLRYTALTLYNGIIDALRKGQLRDLSLIGFVVNTSKFIEETTLTREKIGGLESQYKDFLYHFYFEEGADYQHNYRLPNKVDTFERFGRKTDRIKDVALTIVREMYSDDQINRREVLAEVGVVFKTFEEIEKAYDDDVIDRDGYMKHCRDFFRLRVKNSR